MTTTQRVAYKFIIVLLCFGLFTIISSDRLVLIQPVSAESYPESEGFDAEHRGQFFPYTAVIIDVGHGGIDSGASYGSLLEKDINLAVGKRLYAVLHSRGIPAILNRVDDYALSDDNRWHRTSSRHLKDLSQRMGLTREIEHLIFVSLHVNATTNGSANGPLVLRQYRGESALLAHQVQQQMNHFYQTNKREVPVKSFYVLKHVHSPAILIELGFISNHRDRQILQSAHQQTELATSIANGISNYLWIN